MNVLHGTSVLTPSEHLVVEEFDDGAVVWETDSKRLHQLDVPGRELLRLVDGRRTLSEVFAEAATTFGIAAAVIRRDAMPFLADLVTKGVLTAR